MGDTDDRIRYIAHALGLRSILWKYDVRDTILGPSGVVEPAAIEGKYEEFLQTAKSGAFQNEGAILYGFYDYLQTTADYNCFPSSLMHETSNLTMSEAIKYYPQLKEAFKYLVPVGVALNQTQPYVESDYSLPTFEQYISGTTQTDGPASGSDGSSSTSASRTLTSTRSSTSPTGSNAPSASSGSNGAIAVSSSFGSIFLPAFLLYAIIAF
ncbi:hypothetical protein VNI00_001778 [Paramarasmius palmivorus]|uniref:Uncharacterized protein n=1 Tax=Paramarasmius palmivorus TaxID=297713 RepID=A0AAW0E4X7_9AGAR